MNKKASICLINPPSPWLISDQALAPLGILYLAGYLRNKGFKVNFLDLTGDIYKTDYTIPKADYYGMSFSSPQFVYAKEILKKIRILDSSAEVLVGGVHATSMAREMLKVGFDAVIRGEGELAVEDILNNGITKDIYPLSYLKDIKDIPQPAWDLLDLNKYISNLDVMDYMTSEQEVEREINIMATRGCTGRCAYCTIYKGPLRWRSIDSIINEITYLMDNYGVNRISFCDDNLVILKSWLKELCYRLKAINIKWHCLGRTDQIDYETCKIMKDSGCMGIDFGIESGSQKILDVIQKRVTVEKQEAGLKAAHDAGLKVRAQFMVGLPQETEEDFQQNLDFIDRNNKYVDKWGIHIFIPFPSCEIWENPEKFKYKVNKNTDFSDFQTIGKPGEWNFVPKENQKQIAEWRDKILALIGEKNIYKRKENGKN